MHIPDPTQDNQTRQNLFVLHESISTWVNTIPSENFKTRVVARHTDGSVFTWQHAFAFTLPQSDVLIGVLYHDFPTEMVVICPVPQNHPIRLFRRPSLEEFYTQTRPDSNGVTPNARDHALKMRTKYLEWAKANPPNREEFR